MKQITFSTILIFIFLICSCQNKMVNNKTVKKFDLERYLGEWYEIARNPHSFEKDLVGVTATYSMRDDGKIRVINQGYKHSLDGEISVAEGKAKIPDPSIPGKLKVSFFWIFYADYLVLELDEENYEWAVVGSRSPKYLWILCRKPQMDEITYKQLIQKLEKRGYDTTKLIRVKQKTL